MNPIRIRTAFPAEQKALEALQWRASLNNPGDRAALLANPDAIALSMEQIQYGEVFVAEMGKAILGFAAILPREDGNVELDGLFVEPHAMRQGIGRQLVDYCCEEALADGADYLHVLGNPHAKQFYRACGFAGTGSEATRFGPGLLLKKALG